MNDKWYDNPVLWGLFVVAIYGGGMLVIYLKNGW